MQSGMEKATAAALLALESASAVELLAALETVLRERFSASGMQLWLVDYRLTVLQTVEPAGADRSPPVRSVPVDGSRVGRTFAAQQVTWHPDGEQFEIDLPVSARTDRLGVLSVTVAEEPTPDLLDALSRVARALGHVVIVTNRHVDAFERAARTQRLSVAAELQWQILPGRGCSATDFDLAGQLEPAYHIAGDAFDWSLATDHVTISVHEGMASGTRAAQATNLAVTALRNARIAGMPPADQAGMAGEAIYGMYGGEHWIDTVILRIDRRDGTVTAVDAGSPVVLLQRQGQIGPVALDKQLPLGKFDGTTYRAETFDLAEGDRLVILSDGVHGAPSDRPFGDNRLGSVLRSTRKLSPAETVRQIIRELRDHHEGRDVDDDAVAVVFDWNGGP